MQQTSFDRYLTNKYVHVTQVYCNSLPPNLPQRVIQEETSVESGSRYRYRLTANNDKVLAELATLLEAENITYTSRVEDRGGLPSKLFNNPNRSFTMQLAWLILITVIVALSLSGLPARLWQTLSADLEEFEKRPTPTIIDRSMQ